jgi:plasmid stabilization system protein ParE
MPRLQFSARSRADLAEIWDRIADDSHRNADDVHERLYERCLQLIDQSLMGHRRDEVKTGLRCINSDGYSIFYRLTGTTARISRIVHHARHLGLISFLEP